LAYVEMFSELTTPNATAKLYKMSHSLTQTLVREAHIVPVDDLIWGCHLTPDFGKEANRRWTADTVLDDCKDFFLNTYVDLYTWAEHHNIG
ncbi:hypothetical protein SISNIDRAFT_413478, partial [Sistotremastrum niveocremeum HHB9708]